MAKLEWRTRSDSDRQFQDVVAILAARSLDAEYLERWADELEVADALAEAFAAAE